jgi:hypothetical protein
VALTTNTDENFAKKFQSANALTTGMFPLAEFVVKDLLQKN